MLQCEDLQVAYGPVTALRGVSLDVNPREIVALIGANGAGKSTLLKVLSGLLRPGSGRIRWHGGRIDGWPAERVVRTGIVHVPEGRRVFPGLTVGENLAVAATPWRRRGQSLAVDLERVYDLFPRLRERSRQMAWSLSGGEQQMLAIGRGLMARPQLLLLDEPSLGLAPLLVQEVFDTIRTIGKSGTPVLLVEQNSYMALKISQRAYVLERGEVVLAGPSVDLAQDPRVQEAYLGG